MSVTCRECDHLVMRFEGVLFHYETKKGDEFSVECRSCDCKEAK